MHFMTPFGEYMKDEEEIRKYGRKIQVKPYPKPWKPQSHPTKEKMDGNHTKECDRSYTSDPQNNQSWCHDESWDDRWQKWHQEGTWKANSAESQHTDSNWVRDPFFEMVREYKNCAYNTLRGKKAERHLADMSSVSYFIG